ncbi:META domain-containing protein [Kribbella sp. NPDC051587]|uniref:META domain-containing protein n=1 Tax=Kribbella sp. NPDC051587 TaxID=3364119 RepID=UPI00379428D3
MKRMIALAGAGLLLLGLAACGDESTAGGTLTGKTYLSTSITEDGKPKQLAAQTRVQLQFTDDGRLIASAGCNTMQASVSTGDGKLTLKDPLAMTAMGCPGSRGEQDSWLSNLLQSKPSWKLANDTLTVVAGSTTIALTDQSTLTPDLKLDGTKWTLDSVISQDTVGKIVGSEKAWITFNGERVTGFTGCNELNGVVARAATTVTFGELATTRRACAGDEGTVEKALTKGLHGEMSYEITGDRLRFQAGDAGLSFIAAR